jgi:hypothetical protein
MEERQAPPEVVIFKAGGKYRVHPGTVRVRSKNPGYVLFRNDTDCTVGVWLPVLVEPVPTAWAERAQTGHLSVLGVPRGHYDYAVYIAGENQFAEGNSAPHMIIDD